jgi:penicillin-binding protein 2
VDLVKAIKRSNDIYFYKVGEKLGPVDLKIWADRFGFGKKTDIGIDEAEGLIPSSFWKEDVLKEKWYLGDTYNLSIGQGYMLSTPLQVARMTSVFANNGYLCAPQLLKTTDTKHCINLHISEKTLRLIKEGMKEACAPGGTGWPFFDFKVQRADNKSEPIAVECKTGTAEAHADSKHPHAWFTIFAPAENPEIVVTVLVEESGQGSDIGGPIAKEILKSYFEREQ